MRSHPTRPPGGARDPILEALETRDLPASYHPPFPPVRLPASLVKTLVAEIYGPVTAPDGTVYPVPQPTAREIRRETFYSQWIGTYTIGPPRSTDRASTIGIFSNGNNAGSNQFLKGRSQILLLPPADPSATPNLESDPIAGMVVGLEAYFPTNYLQTSGDLMFDITNLPGVPSTDPSMYSHGLPSRLAWTLDLAGAGVYTQPLYTFDPFTTSGTRTRRGGRGHGVDRRRGDHRHQVPPRPPSQARDKGFGRGDRQGRGLVQ